MTNVNNTILRPDSKGRINLGAFTNNVSSYRATVADNGIITLEPYAEIPLSEKWIFEDKELLKEIIDQSKLKQEQNEKD